MEWESFSFEQITVVESLVNKRTRFENSPWVKRSRIYHREVRLGLGQPRQADQPRKRTWPWHSELRVGHHRDKSAKQLQLPPSKLLLVYTLYLPTNDCLNPRHFPPNLDSLLICLLHIAHLAAGRLKMAATHPRQRASTPSTPLLSTFQKHIEDMRNLVLCKVCIKPLYEPYNLGCGHTYCYTCLASWFGGANKRKRKTCPDCRAQVMAQPSPNYLVLDLFRK